jgi:Mg2+/Co2+ transporter CorB
MLELEMAVLAVLLVLSAFFSGVETALMSVNMVKVKSLLRQRKPGAEALDRLKQDPRRLIITILIGNNLVNIGAASLATFTFTNMFGSAGLGVATGVMTLLILVFGEITPKTFASQNALAISLVVARPIELLSFILWPFVKFFGIVSWLVAKLTGSKEQEQISEEEIKTIVTMGKAEGILGRDAAEMMQNVLEFEGTKVTEIMKPKPKMQMIDGKKKLKDVIDFVVKSLYSRFPVYLNNRDNIIGVLDVDEVLKYAKNKKLGMQVKKAVRKISFVPETKEIDDLLVDFAGKRVPMAVVVDEYGIVSGLVTVVDILEEIVGDIFDKSRKKNTRIKKVNPQMAKVDAGTSIEEVNKVLHLNLKVERFNTLAGFIEHKLQKIPKKGERIVLERAIIEVDKVSNKSIKSVKIIKL